MVLENTLQILERLIQFDTTSRNSNLNLLTYIQNYLLNYKIPCYLDYNKNKDKANLLVTIGPNVPGGIVLSGHTDVVPVDGQTWATPPFMLAGKDDKLYGRGTADMKSFLAICLAMVPEFLHYNLKRPIHLAFSYDEEIGCQGVPSLVDYIATNLPKPAVALIGEPTNLQVVIAHKGIDCFETTITGVEAHSSCTHLGISAIAIAADLIHYLQCLIEATGNDNHFIPAHNSFNVGQIQGGTAINIIPRYCSFTWEMRTLPHTSRQQIMNQFESYCRKKVKKYAPLHTEVDIRTKLLHSCPPLKDNLDNSARITLMQLIGTNQTHRVSFATEAGIFQKAGIPSLVCGPGSINQAHKPNEYIQLSHIEKYISFLRKLGKTLTK